MGYDLHITRKKHWYSDGEDITAEEWQEYIEQDKELTLQPENGSYFALWCGPSKYEQPWFDWYDGRIYCKNPDSPLIDKMVTIAKYFGATVQGDDGETYESSSIPPTL